MMIRNKKAGNAVSAPKDRRTVFRNDKTILHLFISFSILLFFFLLFPFYIFLNVHEYVNKERANTNFLTVCRGKSPIV